MVLPCVTHTPSSKLSLQSAAADPAVRIRLLAAAPAVRIRLLQRGGVGREAAWVLRHCTIRILYHRQQQCAVHVPALTHLPSSQARFPVPPSPFLTSKNCAIQSYRASQKNNAGERCTTEQTDQFRANQCKTEQERAEQGRAEQSSPGRGRVEQSTSPSAAKLDRHLHVRASA